MSGDHQPQFLTQHLQQEIIFFCYRWWLVLQHKTTSKDADIWHTSTTSKDADIWHTLDVHSLKSPYWWRIGDGSGSPVRCITGVEPSVTWTSQHAWGNQQLLFHIQTPPIYWSIGGSVRSHSKKYDLHRIVYVQQRI